MSSTNACPECGARLPADAPRGLCPTCLISAAFASTAARGPEKSAGGGAAVTIEEYLAAVRALGLVDPADLDRLSRASAGDPARLARSLTQAGRLTPYQAGAILQGKAHGLRIGSYLVLEKLGVGGMGVVFKARHRPSGRVVALKMLPPSFSREREAVGRFRREFEVASRLKHPNLVAAIEASEDRGVHFLTMDFLEGYDLDALVADGGPLPIKLALHCAIQAARGLEAAHAQGVVHRDVKPGNIMIDPSGSVRVLDLGLARVIEATSHFGRPAEGTLTQTGATMGTVDFLAPEQADDARRADHRADIYSLGCTLHYLLTGKPPFGGDTVLKRLMAHQSRPAPSLRAARPEVSERIDAFYLRMMAKRPADRPQSMSEVILALEGSRSSAREAGDASADLKTFATTVLKRAVPRGRRGPEASVFARPNPTGGLQFDPDLRLEDLVADYREEIHHGPIPEAKLPPLIPPRPAAPARRRRKNPASAFFWGAFAALGLVVAGFLIFPRDRTPPEPPAAPDVPIETPAVAVKDAGRRPDRFGSAEGFVPLFNGKNLDGWATDPSQPGGWRVESGVLVGSGAGLGHLYSKRGDFADIHLRAEVRINARGNSGIYVRSTGRPAWPAKAPRFPAGYEAQINCSGNDPYQTGSLYDVNHAPDSVLVKRLVSPVMAGDWFSMEVIAEGDRVVVKVNGLTTADYNDPGRPYPAGHVALQVHDEQTVVEFRRIEVREIARSRSVDGPKVPADAASFAGGRYKVFPDDLTWHQAKERSESIGGHLAIIGDEAENRFVTSLIAASGLKSAWLGATDEVAEGRWLWVDGSDLRFRAWDPAGDQPNNKNGNEHYLLTVADRGGLWSDQPDRAINNWHPGFVCEWDGPRSSGASIAGVPAKKGPILYSDDFDDSRSGWPVSSNAAYSRGYVNGVYRIDVLEKSWYYAGPPFKPPAEFACEMVGRVWGDRPSSEGFLILNIDYADVGDYCRVRLHSNGHVSLSTKSVDLAYFTDAPVRTGKDARNKVALEILRKTARVLIDDVPLGEPVALPFESTPRGIGIGVSVKEPNLRGELEHFEVRKLP